MCVYDVCVIDLSLAERLGRCNAGLVLEMLLRKHADHQDLVLSASLAMAALAVLPTNRIHLRKVGSSEVLLLVLHKFVDNAGIVASVSLALGSVCKDDIKHEAPDTIGTIGTIGTNNAYTLLVKILDDYVDSSVVSSAVCRAMAYIAANHNQNQLALITAGACGAVCKILERHVDSEEVTKNAVHAIAELSMNAIAANMLAQVCLVYCWFTCWLVYLLVC